MPFGQASVIWSSWFAFLAIVILWRMGGWYKPQTKAEETEAAEFHRDAPGLRRCVVALFVLLTLLFSKPSCVSRLSAVFLPKLPRHAR
ncbi:hypothetical protein JQ554_09470 [Bradyrhizobium diazoefficiens]|nr:hypothetical protein [Bradyrhizobium diazoefficiens]MBR0968308.1 hypothetical protein [Bradyrhizobium diazoefficiens]MBR0977421.1 hypothetical protein [Bradyrhizobium diazoefficiens]MBR1007897.1 hypothetical protein [Bradyrhizobium diazoefficiens]MBR1013486.1 hypothetical protein [Bradyrhizobium diazoefficiens]MBR1050578.1 hypothetical protein [Bradyrhizobium diazoefficiens]